MTTDLSKLDAANTAIQKQASMAKTTKVFDQAATDAIHSLDGRISSLEKSSTPPPVTPPVDPPPVVIHEPLPIGDPVITKGGTYTRRWVSADPGKAAVTIATNDQVILAGEGEGPGKIIDCGVGPRRLTSGLKVTGGKGRLLTAEGFLDIRLIGMDVLRTAGVELESPAANAVFKMLRHRHNNIQRQGPADGQFGQIVQFREVQTASIELGWFESVNTEGEAEDLISFYKSGGPAVTAAVHDFYIDRQLKGDTGSQNAITTDGDGSGVLRCNNIHVYDGDLINCSGGVRLADYAVDCLVERLWVLRKGGNSDVDGSAPGAIIGKATRCHQHACTYGYVDAGGSLTTPDFSGVPQSDGGAAGELARNTLLTKAQITDALLASRWTTWQAKQATSGVKIGAGT